MSEHLSVLPFFSQPPPLTGPTTRQTVDREHAKRSSSNISLMHIIVEKYHNGVKLVTFWCNYGVHLHPQKMPKA